MSLKEFKPILIFIAGNSDSDDNDIINLEKLVNYLKKLKKINYIILVLKFGERFTGDTKQYIETLGKIFTVSEFFCHLGIVFTKFPNKPNEQDLKTKARFSLEINKLYRKIFKLKDNDIIPENDNIFFIDTKIDKENEAFNEDNQKTVDILLKQIIYIQKKYFPINTENLDISGKSVKARREKELEILKKKIEEEKRMKELAEKKAKEAKKREEEFKKEMLRKKKEIEKANELERKKKEKEYNELLRKSNEDRKRNEEEKKKIEEENKRLLQKQEELKREKEKIEEEKKENQIKFDKLKTLNNVSEGGSGLAKAGGIGILGSIGIGVIGEVITPFCPIAGPFLIGAAIGGGATGAAEVAIGGAIHGIAEYQKQNLLY